VKYLNARTKLNSYTIWTAVIVGAIAGGIFSSWLVFFLVAGGMIASAIYRNEIRLNPTQPKKRPRRRK
jgi:hypothetical protein